MRIPLNKSRTPNRKEENDYSVVGTIPGKVDSMNQEIRKIIEAAEAISQETPETRSQYLKGIADAQEAQRAAAQAKEDAETEEAFNKACDDESHARDKEAFFKRMLDRLDFTPRMEEETYYSAIQTIDSVVTDAAEDFRRVAEKAVKEIVEAKAKYLSIAEDADNALTILDNAANFLQSKYRYRKINYVNAPSVEIEDPSEWKKHTFYYNKGTDKVFRLIARTGEDYNKMSIAAWNAADSVTKGY